MGEMSASQIYQGKCPTTPVTVGEMSTIPQVHVSITYLVSLKKYHCILCLNILNSFIILYHIFRVLKDLIFFLLSHFYRQVTKSF